MVEEYGNKTRNQLVKIRDSYKKIGEKVLNTAINIGVAGLIGCGLLGVSTAVEQGIPWDYPSAKHYWEAISDKRFEKRHDYLLALFIGTGVLTIGGAAAGGFCLIKAGDLEKTLEQEEQGE